ncbi:MULTISPECIES: hypothetical protein [Streptomyces]|uniref:hypothetical protein n=1 Tax=Streptomyces TaxID=1883 RepID=UPI000CD54FD2|nr:MULTISPECIES: hypothetical protein [Streptomyces]
MGIARPLQFALCAAAVTALTAGTAGQAVATPPEPDRHHHVDVRVTPVSPKPGDDVEVRVKGCESHKKATAHSEAFVAEVPLGHDGHGLFGEGRISSSIEPGVYPVDVSCDGKPKAGSARVVVVAHGEHTKHPPKPTAPVHAGGGGAAGNEVVAGPAAPESASETVAPFGVTLLAGGLLAGAAVLAARRRRGGGADGR